MFNLFFVESSQVAWNFDEICELAILCSEGPGERKLQVGPLPVINGVITPINGLING